MQKDTFMDHATQTLASKPLIGISATSGGGILSLMNVLTPYLNFIVLILSLAIGIVTLYGVINKYISKK